MAQALDLFAGFNKKSEIPVPKPPTSILGSYQLPNEQSALSSQNATLAGNEQARQASQIGFEGSANYINQGAQQGIGALNQGISGLGQARDAGAARINEGLAQVQASLSGLIGTTESALQKFGTLAGLGGDSAAAQQALLNDPSYQFRFNEGQRALSFGQAAGGIQGGRAAKELQAYGQGMASQELEAVQGRLLNLIGIGAPAIQQQAQYQMAAGQQISDLYNSTASQQAGLYGQQANIYGQQGSSLASLRQTLAQDLGTSYLADAAAKSQYQLSRNPTISMITQRGNTISSRAVNLATTQKKYKG